MVRGHLTSALIVVILVLTDVQSECVKDDNDDLLSLLFKKIDKMQDKYHDEMIAMREKMQENIDGITEQMQGIRENMQEKIDGMTEQMLGLRENMQEKIDGMTEKRQKMQEEMVRMKEKLQGQEDINELKIERIEERCNQFNNKANDKPSVDASTVSNNETSLAMAVLQLSTSLENLQTCRDIDECLDNNGGCDHHCSNTEGSYDCSCRRGYSLDSNNKTCVDIDECLDNNGGCDHHCTNTEGSYDCSCREDYSFDSNKNTCIAFVEINFSLAKMGQTSIYEDYSADKAFLTSSKYFHSAMGLPQALWIGFAIPVPVVKFSFQSRPDDGRLTVEDGPSKYVFFGSNSADCSDESSMTPLVEDNSGTSFTSANTPKTELVPGNSSFTCYGFIVNAVHGRSDGDKFVTMYNIKLYTTGLKELDLNSIGIKATSSHGDHERPENAFVISVPTSHNWQSAQGKIPQTPQSIWYQFPIPVVVAKYSFRSRFDQYMVPCGPSSYEFFGSNASDCSDQTSWVTLVQDHSDQPFTTDNDPKSGYIPNPEPYLCYGIKVLNIPSRYGSSLTNIRFFTPGN